MEKAAPLPICVQTGKYWNYQLHGVWPLDGYAVQGAILKNSGYGNALHIERLSRGILLELNARGQGGWLPAKRGHCSQKSPIICEKYALVYRRRDIPLAISIFSL